MSLVALKQRDKTPNANDVKYFCGSSALTFLYKRATEYKIYFTVRWWKKVDSLC